MGRTKEVEERDKLIAQMRRDGHSYTEIASELGINQSQVYQALYRYGLTGAAAPQGQGRGTLSDDERASLIEDRRKGATYMALSVKYGVSTGVVNRVIKDAGLVTQRRGVDREVIEVDHEPEPKAPRVAQPKHPTKGRSA